jgi:hypothetical protein
MHPPAHSHAAKQPASNTNECHGMMHKPPTSMQPQPIAAQRATMLINLPHHSSTGGGGRSDTARIARCAAAQRSTAAAGPAPNTPPTGRLTSSSACQLRVQRGNTAGLHPACPADWCKHLSTPGTTSPTGLASPAHQHTHKHTRHERTLEDSKKETQTPSGRTLTQRLLQEHTPAAAAPRQHTHTHRTHNTAPRQDTQSTAPGPHRHST